MANMEWLDIEGAGGPRDGSPIPSVLNLCDDHDHNR